eukprot:GGOE01054047.1.p1 GENE.GGOE01054047.1~~GGOE01054047.1.p1  ORF type:complete len:362 (+),score=73.86 GGOE01054047.1:38-1087(+)
MAPIWGAFPLFLLFLLLAFCIPAAAFDPDHTACGVGCQLGLSVAAFLLLTAAMCFYKCCLSATPDASDELEVTGLPAHPMLAGRQAALSLPPDSVGASALLDSVFRRAADPLPDCETAALPDGDWRGDGAMAGAPEEGTIWVTPLRSAARGAQVPFRVEVLGADPCGRWVSRDGVCCAGTAGIAYAFRKTYISGALSHQPVTFVYEGMARHNVPSVISGHIGINRLPHAGDVPPDGSFTLWVAKTSPQLLRKKTAGDAAEPAVLQQALAAQQVSVSSAPSAPKRKSAAQSDEAEMTVMLDALPSPPCEPSTQPELLLPTPPLHPEPSPSQPPALPFRSSPDVGVEFLPT